MQLAGLCTCSSPIRPSATTLPAKSATRVSTASNAGPIDPVRGAPSRFPVAPVLLIALGVVFLLNNLEIVELRRALRFWPALLIVLGVYLLYIRLTTEAHRERE